MVGYTFVELLSVMVVASGMLTMMLVGLEGRMQALSWNSAALQGRHLATGVSFGSQDPGATIILAPGDIEVTTHLDSAGLGAVHFSAPTGVSPVWAVRNKDRNLTVFSQPASMTAAQNEKKILYEE